MIESMIGEVASIGDVVCVVDKKTQLRASSDFIVLGIAHRHGPDNLMKKYLYLSDGNGVYESGEVRVVTQLDILQENCEEGTTNE